MSLGNRNKTREFIRTTERQNRCTQRDLTRDQRELDKEEKRLTIEIKKRAAVGDQQTCNTLAKQLLNVRKQRDRITAVGGRLNAVTSQQRLASSTIAMGNVLGTTTQVMAKMNKKMDAAGLSKTLQNFDRIQSEMEMRDEMMDDVLSSGVDIDESDEVVKQVFDEIGLDIYGQLPRAPIGTGSLKNPGEKQSDTEELDRIQAQLDNLRS